MLEMRSIDVEGRYRGRDDGNTCLIIAAGNGHLAICRLLIDKGAKVEAKNSGDWTPLHSAASRGHIEIVCLLCDRGADVEARTNDEWHPGSRPLYLAAYNGHISVVKELIEERNAEINARNGDGRTALRMARDQNETDIASHLVSHGGLDLGVFEDVEEDDDDDDDNDDDEADVDDDDNVNGR
jgi:ankyrin repeat protein